MKRILSLFLMISAINLSAQNFLPDYYTGRETIKTSNEEYSVRIGKYSGCSVAYIDNIKNTLSKESAMTDRRTWKKVDTDYSISIWIDTDRLIEIVSEVLGGEALKYLEKSSNNIDVRLIVNPDTERIGEMSFSLNFTDSDQSLLSIPPQKFEEFESKAKKDIECWTPPHKRYFNFFVDSFKICFGGEPVHIYRPWGLTQKGETPYSPESVGFTKEEWLK